MDDETVEREDWLHSVLAKRDQHLNVLALMFHHQKTLSDQNEIDVSYFCTITAWTDEMLLCNI